METHHNEPACHFWSNIKLIKKIKAFRYRILTIEGCKSPNATLGFCTNKSDQHQLQSRYPRQHQWQLDYQFLIDWDPARGYGMIRLRNALKDDSTADPEN